MHQFRNSCTLLLHAIVSVVVSSIRFWWSQETLHMSMFRLRKGKKMCLFARKKADPCRRREPSCRWRAKEEKGRLKRRKYVQRNCRLSTTATKRRSIGKEKTYVSTGSKRLIWHGFFICNRKDKFLLDLHKDVVDGDVDQLDDEANDAHDEEAHGNGLGDLEEFYCSQSEKEKSISCT